MQQVAQLHKADIGLEVTFVDTAGWDNHVNEGGAQGQLANLLRDLGQSMAAFSQDMGDRMEDIVLVTMSEFGRTAHENGNRGTDHGHANCMLVMGGDVQGRQGLRQMAGPGSRTAQRGARSRVDHRFPLGSGRNHLQASGKQGPGTVFPGFANDPRKFPNLITNLEKSPNDRVAAGS
jgi:hypothetical protein